MCYFGHSFWIVSTLSHDIQLLIIRFKYIRLALFACDKYCTCFPLWLPLWWFPIRYGIHRTTPKTILLQVQFLFLRHGESGTTKISGKAQPPFWTIVKRGLEFQASRSSVQPPQTNAVCKASIACLEAIMMCWAFRVQLRLLMSAAHTARWLWKHILTREEKRRTSILFSQPLRFSQTSQNGHCTTEI